MTTNMRGLGDLVAKGTQAIGIKPKSGCGCQKRQEALNRLVPFKRTEKDKTYA